MSQKQPKNVERDKPSTSARRISYAHVWKLMNVMIKMGFDKDQQWADRTIYGTGIVKRWIVKFTPPDKRGGPSEH